MPEDLKQLFEEGALMGSKVTMRVWRGDADGGEFHDYTVVAEDGEVVLDVLHRLQADAGRRPGGPLELQGRPVRLVQRRGERQAAAHVHDAHEHLPEGRADHGRADEDVPARQGPGHRRVVQLRDGQAIPPLAPRELDPKTEADGHYRMQQQDIERVQEFRKCIECFLCQNVCHVIRDHEENKRHFAGPRFIDPPRRAGDAPARHDDRKLPADGPRLLQHHEVLHRGVSRGHPHHRQRDHPA